MLERYSPEDPSLQHRLLALICLIFAFTPVSAHTDAQGEVSHLQVKLDASDARHLLERTGIGAHPVEIQSLIGLSRAEGVARMLAQLDVTAPFMDIPDILERRYAHYNSESDREADERQSFQIKRNQEMDEFRLWWISELISSPNPAGERLLLLWHNHFVTAYSGLNEEVDAMIAQHLMLREQGTGNFRDLLRAIIRDAAMLNYLDNSSNRKESPNENLGRELLELFVLGEGNYSEQDVKEVARALTGYDYNRIRRFEAEFNAWSHDERRKTVFGQRGNFDGDDIVDILLEKPETAEFLTRTFWRAYVSEFYSDPDELAAIARRFRASDYEIQTLLQSVWESRGFWADSNRGTIVKSPVDLMIGSIRTSGKLPQDWQRLPYTLSDLGQNLFEAPNVAGWPGGADWLTASRIIKRTEALNEFVETQPWSSEQSASAMPAMMDLMTESTIRVRYAAEDFEGPPVFFVRAFSDLEARDLLWSSPAIAARNGLDTARYGRADNGVGLTWEVAEFEWPSDLQTPAAFRIYFGNDHCCGEGGSDGGDRNLFIDWLQHQDRLFLADDGVQNPGCGGVSSRDDPAGNFYCSGRLSLTKATKIEPTNADEGSAKSGLAVGRVYFDGGREFTRRENYNWFSIGLDDVRFEDIEIDAMRLEVIAKRMNGRMGLALKLSQRDCYPDCWNDRWPNASWTERKSTHKLVELPLNDRTQHDSERQYSQLSQQQKRFVGALWHALPTFLEEMQAGRQWRRRDGETTLATWESMLKPFEARLKNSRYARLAPEQAVRVEPHNADAASMMSMMAASMNTEAPIVLGLLRDDLDWTGSEVDQAALMMSFAADNTGQDFSFAKLIRQPSYQVK